MNGLSSGTLLQGGKYKIEKILGQGGFGITYLAEQVLMERKVCIKEFFMKEYSERTTAPAAVDVPTVIVDDATVWTGVSAVTSAAAEIMGRYREKFVKEAKTIAKLDHPGIVRIHDVFEENGTAYYVMDYIEGDNLNEMVKGKGPFSEERALGYIRQVADALSYVHGKNIMHLDVKPANVIVRKSDDKAILIDFGTAKQYDSDGTQTSTTPIGLSAGYAPIEMTKLGGVQTFSAETDVYSLGATLYYLISGQNPPDASERMEMIMEGESLPFPDFISENIAGAIEKAMHSKKKRFQTVVDFLEALPVGKTEESFVCCLNCGEKLMPGAKFCPNCGTAVEIVRSLPILNEVQDDESNVLNSTSGSGTYLSDDVFDAMPGGNLLTDDDWYYEMEMGEENHQKWVDLGLSVMWAAYDLGTYCPSQPGDLFAWGDIKSRVLYFEWDTYKYYRKSFWGIERITKYNSSDKMGMLMQSDDAAYHSWKGNWRIPTDKECEELIDNCDFMKATLDGRNGIRVISRINGKSLFFPSSDSHCYWTSSVYSEKKAWIFIIGNISRVSLQFRCAGCRIRPVCHR